MVKNPQSFLKDSNYEILRTLGGSLHPGTDTSGSPDMSILTNFDTYLTSSLLKDKELFPLLKKNILLLRTGIEFIDKKRYCYFKSSGFCVSFFDFFVDEEIDDFEYRAKKSPKDYFKACNELLDECEKLSIDSVVFPYDCTNVMGGLALSLRAINVSSLTYLLPLDAVLRKYEGSAYHFVSDYILIDPEFSSSISNVTAFRDVYGASLIDNTPDISNSRYRLGISPANDVIIFFAPAIQLEIDAQEYEKTVSNILKSIKSRVDDNTHLIIVSKSKKGGFLGKIFKELFGKFHRVTKLAYSDSFLINGALNGALVYAPCGMLASGGFELKEYAYENSTNVINRFKEVLWVESSKNYGILEQLEDVFDVFDGPILDVLGNGARKIAVPDPIENKLITEGRQKYLLELLNCNDRQYGATEVGKLLDASYFVQWGAEPNEPKARPEKNRIELKRPKLLLEDGFIRSLDLWTDPNVPTLSVVMDTQAIYYDALHPSLLENILNSDFSLTDTQFERASNAIQRIFENKISKYNYAPKIDIPVRENRKNILLIDQKSGDMSIKYGMADHTSFENMLDEALSLSDDCDIYIKLHPIAISEGGDAAHYTFEKLGEIASRENVFIIGFDVNPYSLISAMDEVWVVSSGMGFEALMANKKVRCFGVPFYSNWGLTQDYKLVERRCKNRGLEEIFYVFYIILSRYVDPVLHESCELEDLIQYFERVLVAGNQKTNNLEVA